MPTITLYGLKNCDTCKKAIKALEGAGKAPVFVDIRTEADLAAKVPAWLEAAGADALINRRSTTWRTLSETDREGAPATLLTDNPTLIKRPVIETGDKLFIGWGKDVSDRLAG